MTKILSMKKGTKEERLQEISKAFEELKEKFSEVVDEYEAENADGRTVDLLYEALAAVDDTIDGINDVLM